MNLHCSDGFHQICHFLASFILLASSRNSCKCRNSCKPIFVRFWNATLAFLQLPKLCRVLPPVGIMKTCRRIQHRVSYHWVLPLKKCQTTMFRRWREHKGCSAWLHCFTVSPFRSPVFGFHFWDSTSASDGENPTLKVSLDCRWLGLRLFDRFCLFWFSSLFPVFSLIFSAVTSQAVCDSDPEPKDRCSEKNKILSFWALVEQFMEATARCPQKFKKIIESTDNSSKSYNWGKITNTTDHALIETAPIWWLGSSVLDGQQDGHVEIRHWFLSPWVLLLPRIEMGLKTSKLSFFQLYLTLGQKFRIFLR